MEEKTWQTTTFKKQKNSVDHCFQKAGFNKQRLFYTQGDYGLFQCSVPCRNKTYDNEEIVRKMVKNQRDMKIPSELVPKCPVCGKPMTMNLRSDDKFVEDDGWHLACERYERFIKENKNKKVLYLELGVGMNTPVIIKYPFWRLTAQNQKAHYVCVNMDMAYVPDEIEDRSLCFSEDIALTINALNRNFKLWQNFTRYRCKCWNKKKWKMAAILATVAHPHWAWSFWGSIFRYPH